MPIALSHAMNSIVSQNWMVERWFLSGIWKKGTDSSAAKFLLQRQYGLRQREISSHQRGKAFQRLMRVRRNINADQICTAFSAFDADRRAQSEPLCVGEVVHAQAAEMAQVDIHCQFVIKAKLGDRRSKRLVGLASPL